MSEWRAIYVENTGLRHGPAEAMERLARGEPVDPGISIFAPLRALKPPPPNMAGSLGQLFYARGRATLSCLHSFFEVT